MTDIEIFQDYECDEFGEVDGPMDVYWCRGHVDHDEFLRAVIDYCLGYGRVPAIHHEDRPRHQWQRNVRIGDTTRYDRSDHPPERRHSPDFAITVIDLNHRVHGTRRCSIHGCENPWNRMPSVRVVIDEETADHVNGHMAAEISLCAEHSRRFTEPHYRWMIAPVGYAVVSDTVLADLDRLDAYVNDPVTGYPGLKYGSAVDIAITHMADMRGLLAMFQITAP